MSVPAHMRACQHACEDVHAASASAITNAHTYTLPAPSSSHLCPRTCTRARSYTYFPSLMRAYSHTYPPSLNCCARAFFPHSQSSSRITACPPPSPPPPFSLRRFRFSFLAEFVKVDRRSFTKSEQTGGHRLALWGHIIIL